MNMYKILVVNGAEKLKDLMEKYREKLEEYNRRLSGRSIRLRETVICRGERKYAYWYWYRMRYDSTEKQSYWEYVGKEKPSDAPEMPKNPLKTISYEVRGPDLLMDEDEWRKVKQYFKEHRVYKVKTK